MEWRDAASLMPCLNPFIVSLTIRVLMVDQLTQMCPPTMEAVQAPV